MEKLPAVTFMAALDAGINSLYVSPQIETLLGFTQKQWLEDPVLWYRQLHPDDRERWHTEFALTLRRRASTSARNTGSSRATIAWSGFTARRR